ncbi:MAG: chitinase [Solirubrobacteraceae bacterium]|jgi:hypothetical protein|nr:chitinase [Solirubrobacteraceae bacterium]
MTRVLAILGVLLAALGAVRTSGATFTASAAPNGASFATASDWVAPAVTLTTPVAAAFLSTATPTLSGVAGIAAGDLATVTVRVYSGASATGTPVQTRTATASGTAWTTTATTLADGQYTAQATQSDGAGNTGTSAALTFTVDTAKPTATSVSTTNKAGTTAGHLDSGDVVTFAYAEAVAPVSVLAGWSGASTSVKVRFTNGSFGATDTFTVLDAGANATVHLGSVDTKGDFVSATATFAATMARSADGASIVVTLGTPASVQPTAVAAKNMVWTVGAGIADLAANAIATPATWTETDGDVDF